MKVKYDSSWTVVSSQTKVLRVRFWSRSWESLIPLSHRRIQTCSVLLSIPKLIKFVLVFIYLYYLVLNHVKGKILCNFFVHNIAGLISRSEATCAYFREYIYIYICISAARLHNIKDLSSRRVFETASGFTTRRTVIQHLLTHLSLIEHELPGTAYGYACRDKRCIRRIISKEDVRECNLIARRIMKFSSLSAES